MRTIAAAWMFFVFVYSVGAGAYNLGLRHKDVELRSTYLSAGVTPAYSKLGIVEGRYMKLVHAPAGTADVIVVLNNEGDIAALETGSNKSLWRLSLLDDGDTVYSSGLVYHNGIVVCAVNNIIYGIDMDAGEIRWKGFLGSFLSGDLVAINEGESVAALTIGNYLYVYDTKTGGLVWHHEEMGSEVYLKGSRSVAYDQVRHHVVLLLSDGKVSCFDSYSGDKVWSQTLRGERSDFVGRINTSPVIAAGEVFFVSADSLISLSASSGMPVWEEKDPNIKGVTAVGDVVVYYTKSGRNGAMVAIDAVTKKQLWVLSLDKWNSRQNTVWSAPVHAGKKLWVFGGAGYLLGIDVTTGSYEEVYVSSLFRYYSQHPAAIGSSLYAAADKKRGLMIVS